MTRRHIYIIGGIVLLVFIAATSIITFLVLPSIISSNNTQAQTVPTATPTPILNEATIQYLKQYASDIEKQIAQGLHLTSDQLTQQLQAGKTLRDVAKAQNISLAQLRTIIANAVQSGLKPAADAGNLSQKQVKALSKRLQSDLTLLDNLFSTGTGQL
ncbi:MAG TPA: hypothetical protein VKY19_29965 [Ktedonosporobacter sp.]|jgi:flagellar basal body-associated protein FliL|nr:hypothetical protein [Ktedonosporobacter sp.]